MLRSKIRDIKIKAEAIFEEFDELDGTRPSNSEIKKYVCDIASIADECLVGLNCIESDLIKLIGKIRQ